MDDQTTPAADPIDGFAPVPRRARHDGWTADRQRAFIRALAETGCISVAAEEVGVTPRSAYRLRGDPAGARFREAWDLALAGATGRLATMAFERALRGEFRETWRNGELVSETRVPSDKLLMFLLRQLDRHKFGPVDTLNASYDDYVPRAVAQLPRWLDKLTDVDAVQAEPLVPSNFEPSPPRRPER